MIRLHRLVSILNAAVLDKLNEQFAMPDKLKEIASKLCENVQLHREIIINDREFLFQL